jgi:hypothetical protein
MDVLSGRCRNIAAAIRPRSEKSPCTAKRAAGSHADSGKSLRETPSNQLKGKRAELEAHANELKNRIDEIGMAEAEAEAKMVMHLKTSGELPPHLTVPLEHDIAETIRQRGEAKRMLSALEKAINQLPA